MDPALNFFLIIGVVVLLILVLGFRRVPPEKKATIVTLGKPGRNVGPGPLVIVPWVQEVRAIDARVAELNPTIQGVLTKDGVPVDIDLFYTRRITDPRKAQFDVKNPDTATLGIVRGYLVKAIGRVTTNQLVTKPEVKDEITKALDDLATQIEGPFGIDVGNMEMERFRLPQDLEQARTDIRIAAEQRKARITRARAEADVTDIEREAQEQFWPMKTQWDSLVEMTQGPRPPLIVVSPQTGFPALPGVSDDVQRGILGAVAESLERIEKLLGGGKES